VEYATREQAQAAVATLSNQNLMGRLVYVREDREAEPRFIGATGGNRGGFGGGMAGGFNPGYGGAPGGGPPGGAGGGRQLYIANVCATLSLLVFLAVVQSIDCVTASFQHRMAGFEGPLPPGSPRW
jgi:predicted lipid-binding transport protein (Tim44 family)